MIETQNLTHIYMPGSPFEQVALHQVSVQIPENRMVGIIGHTGSGKSTFIQHLNGLLKPHHGRVLLDGEELSKSGAGLRTLRFTVGLVFQYPEHQLFEETVYKDIAFGPTNMKLSTAEIDARVRRAAELTGISPDLFDHSPFELSGGQKRRVAIAGVLAMEPKVLILDEPTAGLDPIGRDEILNNLVQIQKSAKSTVLLVSHSMEDVARTCDHVLVFNHGKVFASGTVDEVFSRSEELAAIGLSIPQAAKIAAGLRHAGVDLPQHLYTVEALCQALLPLLTQNGGATA